jgi:hypothetical protein
VYTEGQDTRFAASRLLVLATNLNEIEAHRQQTLREMSCRSERQEPAALIIAAVLTIAEENARRPSAVDLRHYFANCRLAARPQQVTRPPGRARQHVLRTTRRRRRRASPLWRLTRETPTPEPLRRCAVVRVVLTIKDVGTDQAEDEALALVRGLLSGCTATPGP